MAATVGVTRGDTVSERILDARQGESIAMGRQAAILVGGRGTRLGPLVQVLPKPLMPVAGEPFLVHLIRQLATHGFDRIVLLAGYRADRIREALGNGDRWGVHLLYRVEDSPLGTGGALAAAADDLQETFLLVNGDTLFDFDVSALAGAATPEPWLVRMALGHATDTSRYGTVDCDGQRVIRFTEKAASRGDGLINAGYYWMRRTVLSEIDRPPTSLEHDVLPGLAARGLVLGLRFAGTFIDIGTPQDLARADRVVGGIAGRPSSTPLA